MPADGTASRPPPHKDQDKEVEGWAQTGTRHKIKRLLEETATYGGAALNVYPLLLSAFCFYLLCWHWDEYQEGGKYDSEQCRSVKVWVGRISGGREAWKDFALFYGCLTSFGVVCLY